MEPLVTKLPAATRSNGSVRASAAAPRPALPDGIVVVHFSNGKSPFLIGKPSINGPFQYEPPGTGGLPSGYDIHMLPWKDPPCY